MKGHKREKCMDRSPIREISVVKGETNQSKILELEGNVVWEKKSKCRTEEVDIKHFRNKKFEGDKQKKKRKYLDLDCHLLDPKGNLEKEKKKAKHDISESTEITGNKINYKKNKCEHFALIQNMHMQSNTNLQSNLGMLVESVREKNNGGKNKHENKDMLLVENKGKKHKKDKSLYDDNPINGISEKKHEKGKYIYREEDKMLQDGSMIELEQDSEIKKERKETDNYTHDYCFEGKENTVHKKHKKDKHLNDDVSIVYVNDGIVNSKDNSKVKSENVSIEDNNSILEKGEFIISSEEFNNKINNIKNFNSKSRKSNIHNEIRLCSSDNTLLKSSKDRVSIEKLKDNNEIHKKINKDTNIQIAGLEKNNSFQVGYADNKNEFFSSDNSLLHINNGEICPVESHKESNNTINNEVHKMKKHKKKNKDTNIQIEGLDKFNNISFQIGYADNKTEFFSSDNSLLHINNKEICPVESHEESNNIINNEVHKRKKHKKKNKDRNIQIEGLVKANDTSFQIGYADDKIEFFNSDNSVLHNNNEEINPIDSNNIINNEVLKKKKHKKKNKDTNIQIVGLDKLNDNRFQIDYAVNETEFLNFDNPLLYNNNKEIYPVKSHKESNNVINNEVHKKQKHKKKNNDTNIEFITSDEFHDSNFQDSSLANKIEIFSLDNTLLQNNEDSILVERDQKNEKVYKKKKKHKKNKDKNVNFSEHKEYWDNESSSIDAFNEIGFTISDKNPKKNKPLKKKLFNANRNEIFEKKNDASHDQERMNIVEVQSHENVELIDENIDKDDFMFYDTYNLDSNEEPVNFTVPLLHQMEKLYTFSQEEKNNLLANRVVIKKERFSKFEDNLLKRNYTNFTSQFGINDPYVLLGIDRKRSDPDVMKFLKAKHFYVRLGKDLNDRTLKSIYKRARNLFHPSKDKGKINKEEILKLKKLHSLVGNKWETIGKKMDRSGSSIEEAFRWHECKVNKGRWTLEEEKLLFDAVKNVTDSEDPSKLEPNEVCWNSVANIVCTRNASQCRFHWGHFLANSVKKTWDSQCFLKLVDFLERECNVEYDTKINWKKVQKEFTDVSPSYMFLQRKWRYLRRRTPTAYKNDYRKMLEFLSKKYGKYKTNENNEQ